MNDLSSKNIFNANLNEFKIKKSFTSVTSVDFFDTLCWRKYADPKDVFVKWAQKIKVIGDIKLSDHSLASLRVGAENKARKKKFQEIGTWEVDLYEIYAEFPSHVIPSNIINIAIEAEIAAEYENLILDAPLLTRLIQNRLKDEALVICSDTYLPREAFNKFLSKTPYSLDHFDAIYLSHEHRLCKADGLIRKVSKDFYLEPLNVTHIGDHQHNDIRSARMVGSIAKPYAVPGDSSQIIERNMRKLQQLTNSIKPFAESTSGIYGFARRFIHSASTSTPNEDAAIVAYSLGPLFVSYFRWLSQTANDENRSVIIFPTREGITLSALFKFYQRHHDPSSTIRGLHFPTSRKALDFTDLEDRPYYATLSTYFYNRRNPVSAAMLAQRIHSTLATVNIDFSDFDYPIRHGDEKSASIVRALLQDDTFLEGLKSYAGKARKNALQFARNFLSTHEAKPSDIIIADIGWSGGIFKKIASIFSTLEPQATSVGRYFLVDSNVELRNLDGEDIRGFLCDTGEAGRFGNLIINSKEILEQFLTGFARSVASYDKYGELVYGNATVQSTAQTVQKARLHRLVSDYFLYLKNFCKDDIDFSKDALELALARICAYPTPYEANSLSYWGQDDNYSESRIEAERSDTLVDHSIPSAQKYSVFDDFFRLPNYWPFGASTLYRPNEHDAIVFRAITAQWGAHSVGDHERKALIAVENKCPNTEAILGIHNAEVNFYITPNKTGILRHTTYTSGPIKIWIENLTLESLEVAEAQLSFLSMVSGKLTTTNNIQIEKLDHKMWHSRVSIGLSHPRLNTSERQEVSMIISIRQLT